MRKIQLLSILVTSLAFSLPLAAQSAPSAGTPAPSGCPAPGERPFRPGGPPAAGAGQRNGLGPAAANQQAPPPGGPNGSAATQSPARKRLLIWADTRNGIAQHDIGHAIAVIEELGYKSGLWDTWIRTDSNIIAKRPKMTNGQPASGGPSLCNVDAIFFMGHREIDLDATGKADLLWFVHEAGKGFVSAHVGTTAFMESWPEFGEMIGGKFDQHPWGTIDANVIVTDPKFPGMEKLGKEFTIRDEIYQTKDFSPEKSRVLLRLDTSKLDMSRPEVKAADYPYPLAWARMYGKGRVFYASFAHAPATWDDPRVQDIYLGAIKWALGLVDADVTPNPNAYPPAPKPAGQQ